jgi:hypothetical protein
MTTKTKVIFAFAMIFLIGFASGYLFERAVISSDETVAEQRSERGERERAGQRDGDRGDWVERAQKRLSRDLELTESQKEPLFEKIRDYHVNVHDLIKERREDEHEKIKDKYSMFRDEISSILNAEQLERMDSHFHPDTVRAKMERRDGPPRERMHRGRN